MFWQKEGWRMTLSEVLLLLTLVFSVAYGVLLAYGKELAVFGAAPFVFLVYAF